ncbi:LCP family protein [Antrihabitans cavernicola]|uniref:LCP family protein n=1 Tax=Antrihabitans cavernicola TaxID=2495913 RepID=UPI001F1E7CE3|nr:LCP family protein [Spelaeibacter cavernicola]
MRPNRPSPPPAGGQAWSQVPEPPILQRREAPRPQQPPPARSHAPTQQPQPFAEPPPPRRPGRAAVPPRKPPKPLASKPPREPKPPRNPKTPKPRRKRRWGRRIGLLLLVLLIAFVGSIIYLDRALTRIDALADYPDRVGDTPGTNWLLVGSDSRSGLTPDQEQALATGGDTGAGRTDSIILIHIPKSGRSTMVSIPRDSYVDIPGNGKDKINAAFAFGGAPLLVQTVEGATGIHIDHYVEIGFDGFSGMVDAVGGIDVCLKQPMNDPLAGVNLPAGCQKLKGPQALGFVRSRATALADLDRMNNQRQFMSSLMKKATSASTFLNPFRLLPLIDGTAKSLTVDNGDHLWNLAGLAWAMKGDMVTTTVPIGGFEDEDGSGNVALWDHDKADQFFGALAKDQQIPDSLLTVG